MALEPGPQLSTVQMSEKKEGLVGSTGLVNAGVENGGTGKKVDAAPVNVEDMDEEVLQEQAQAVVEELQKRGACTTLALSRMLGMDKSTELNPLLYLLLEKNVVVRVTDMPPIWSLSPTFPISPLPSSASAAAAAPAAPAPVVQAAAPAPAPVVQAAAPALAPECSCPALAANAAHPAPTAIADSRLPSYTGVQSLQPARIMPDPPPAVNRHAATIITFPPIPEERTVKPIITFPPIPAEPPQAPSLSESLPATPGGTLQQQQFHSDYWQSLSQIPSGRNNRNGGRSSPFKKGKKQKSLSELQVRLLKELKERGPTRTLELSKIVGLVTCRDVNPSIYDLKQRNLVIKVNNAPPVWQLNEPGMNRPQYRPDTDEDEEECDREMTAGMPFGSSPLTVNPQGHSSLSFFH